MPEAILPGGATGFCLRVWGPFACFTRPELKAERFSYPVITPSAARGVFDAIYCKPIEFRWAVRRIEVVNPIKYIALRRNEVKEKVNVNAVERWMSGDGQPEPIWADGDKDTSGSDEKGRTQRQTMALQDVEYRVWAHIVPWPGCPHNHASLSDQFLRRVKSGKCFQQPYFGCREFPAYFELANPDDGKRAISYTADLGIMLYDVFDLARPQNSGARPMISVFRAQIDSGVLEVPPYEDSSVFKSPIREMA